jgi:mannose-6-phosphate isomerase-like protein (cupin superfamily)
VERTTDRREKYWGQIETVASREFVVKRIAINPGGQSSLEFHVRKSETYYVHSGSVRVGLRIGRGENRSVDLQKGDCFHVCPGLMHMRIGLEPSVIIEVSTPDSDADSFLVEDGRTYRHVES